MAHEWGGTDGWALDEFEAPAPQTGEVTIRIVAAGVNPADVKAVTFPRPGATLPVPIGFEVAGTISAIGADTRIGSGAVAVGDEVVAFRVPAGYATEITVPAKDVFAKPEALSHEQAANLLLAGTTAAQMLDVTRVSAGDTVLLHGASGAVGVSVLQQAAVIGARVIGTASAESFDRVAEFGGIPVAYGPGLADRVRAAAGGAVDAALDAAGTAEAVDVSLELVADRSRLVTIVINDRATDAGFEAIGGAQPHSAAFRDAARPRLLQLAAEGRLTVPIARTYPLAEAPAALAFLMQGHPGGKIALLT
jgi:NADPH:quinone reductase-like Zn-dependent oxidoreductase